MHFRKAIAAAALVLAATTVPALADVKDGVDAWSRGDYDKAVAQWRAPAAKGDADAQFNLAQAYKLGKGVTADLEQAEALYLKAARQGHLQAADTYGLLLFQSGRRRDALTWLAASADRGEPRAQYILGIAHYNGDLVPQDRVRAYALMSRAAASGLNTARDTLGAMDRALPLEQRQQGVALAAELEAKASQSRAAQLASLGLGGSAKPAPAGAAAKVALQGTGSEPARPIGDKPAPLKVEPVTAGADFAGPVVLGKPAAAAPTPAKAKVAAAMPVPPGPAAAPAATGAWRVQLGAFGVAGNAQALWGRLKGNPALAGRQPYYVPSGKLTRLQAGPFASRAEAQAACDRLSGQACIPQAN